MAAPAPRRDARLRWRLAVALLALVALPGCTGTQPHGEELYATARQANLLFKEAVGAVLVHLSDEGAWQVQEYGDLPVDCHPGYAFSLHRTTFEGWTLEADAVTTADRLAGWLTARGWQAQVATSSSGAVTADPGASPGASEHTDPAAPHDGHVVVEASGPDVAVATLVIEIRDGAGSADAIGVGATTECFHGDAEELTALLYPGYPDHPVDHEPLPAGEPAGATPIFGFTEDGRPR
ncbi:MAG TPA: hypothetical protein VIP82_11950 [Microbacterium sp.]|jgi:hypothetical protein|uniref:hypothetical protein n=1 Tax=Microbacterium sp. TaxID=51671 RepID=UPI002F95E205